MLKSEIISAIEKRVMGAKTKKYSIWTIGITNNPKRRKEEHENEKEKTEHWMDWKADSENDARAIEKHFLDKGMKGSGGGGDHPTYVYIF